MIARSSHLKHNASGDSLVRGSIFAPAAQCAFPVGIVFTLRASAAALLSPIPLDLLREFHTINHILNGGFTSLEVNRYIGYSYSHSIHFLKHPLRKFSKKNNLPHINPKAFRHTMASILIKEHKDVISVSKRLGHAKPSTTTDIYAHIIKEADEQSSESLADVILRPNNLGIEEKKSVKYPLKNFFEVVR